MRRLRGLGFGVIVVALTVGIIAGVVTAVQHIPRPEKKIAWVQREDSIIVQMKTDDASGLGLFGQIEKKLEVPEFTLYGDGTLIVKKTNSQDPSSYTLREAKLSTSDVRSLMKFIDGTEFFNFSYEQPPIEGLSTRSTTYFYAATKEAQNAVSAKGIDSTASGAGAWDDFRQLQRIKSRLDEIRRDAIGNNASEYRADTILIYAQQTFISDGINPEWPFPDIDLQEISSAPNNKQPIEGAAAQEVQQQFPPFSDGLFANNILVGYRPVLPYEEHFPEFDTTQ